MLVAMARIVVQSTVQWIVTIGGMNGVELDSESSSDVEVVWSTLLRM